AGGGRAARDGGRRPDRRRRERSPSPPALARSRLARDASARMPPDLAPRRPALGAAVPLPRRAPRRGAKSRRAAADHPGVSRARALAGGAVVTTDVIVVGAGAGGAATAILVAEHGLSVRLLDRARFPRPKICGEYLSPEAPRLLDRLGALKAVDAAASALKGMRITAPDGRTLVATYRPIEEWRPYREYAMAITREALDAILVDRVRSLPVDFREQTRVTDLVVSGDRVLGVEAIDGDARRQPLRAPLTIAADGRASVVAQRLGLRRPHRLQRMAMVTYVEDVSGLGQVGEIFVDPPDYAILNPVAPGRANLSVVVPLSHAAPWSGRLDTFFDARVKHLPHLARRIEGGRRVAPRRAMVPTAYPVNQQRAR